MKFASQNLRNASQIGAINSYPVTNNIELRPQD